MEGLHQYVESLTHAAEDCAQFPRTRALAVKRVVDEIYQQISVSDTLQFVRLPQTVEISIESADVNLAVHYGRSGIHVFANLNLRYQLAILGRQRVHPAALIAKNHAAINDRRRAPYRRSGEITPNEFTVSG